MNDAPDLKAAQQNAQTIAASIAGAGADAEPWTLEDFVVVLVLDAPTASAIIGQLLGKTGGVSPVPPFTPPAPDAEPGAATPIGATNVPIPGAVDALDVMGVKDPGTPAEHQAAGLIKRAAYYDAITKQKAQGK